MGQDLSTGTQSLDLTGMQKYSGFSPKQVEMIKERFELMCDEDQSIEKDTFAKLLKISQKEADAVFELFDMDQSGRVDSYEFVCGLALLSQSTLHDKAEIIFNLYDFDKSQVLSKEELIVLMKTTLSSLNAMAKKSGPTLKDVEIKANEVLSRWDTNKDGVISLSEFRSYVTKDPDILRLLMSYGLVNPEELRTDFGGTNTDVPDCDSDLEDEIHHNEEENTERIEKIKLGAEFKPKQKDPNDLYDVEEVNTGDQFMAVKPWIGVVKNSVPRDYVKKKGEDTAPEATLQLEYVHGYRCHDTRNNLKYAPNGHAIYHTAAVGVVLDGKSNTQKFFCQHTDDITCLDTWGDLVVTGQVGESPSVCVWDYNNPNEVKAMFKGYLHKSISQVCFSNNGKRVAAVANDDDHTIGIFNLENFLKPNYDKGKAKTDGTILIGKGPKAAVLDAKFDPSDQLLILACLKEINFVSFDGNVIKCVKGSGWGKNPAQALLCIGFIDQSIVTGGFSGSLFVWKGKSLFNTVPAHTGSVNAIWSRKGATKGVITGGNDGLINIWDHTIKKIQTIDIKIADIGSMNPKVRSVCDNGKDGILIGTRGGEIVEFVNNKAKVLMKGHFDDELWGLAVHPKRNEYYTVGEDTLLASWDIASRKQKQGTKLDYKAKALAFSPDDKFLAVGCVNGFVLILNPTNFSLIQTLKDRTKEISQMRFSPNSEFLAVGAHDSEIFVYNVKEKFKIQAKMRGHHSTVTHLDFSTDSNVLQSTSTSYDILYFNSKNGKRDPSGASANRDEKWATWTCILGWPVQGIWPPCSDGSDINSVDRHPQGNVLATADDFSKVKLFRYPCPVDKAAYTAATGHSSHVTNVRFTTNGSYLISTGGHDKSIFQWKYQFDREGDEQAQEISNSVNTEEQEEQEDKPMFEEDVIEGGDEALAVKPFKGEVDRSKPTGFKLAKDAAQAPDGNLKLKYCHGYRCFRKAKEVASNTAKYCADPSKVVFVGAALGVSMDIKTKEQSFFQMHEEDVVCLAIHPNGKIAASGQMAQRIEKSKAKNVSIHVWDIETKAGLAHINDFHQRAIALVCFSPDGTKLLSCGEDDDNSVAIHDWAQKILLATVKVDKARVTGLCYKSETEFMTCGIKHVKFYSGNGKNITPKRGTLDTSQQSEAFLCGTYAFKGVAICGTQTGNLIPFNGSSAGKSVKAHAGCVWTLCKLKDNLLSGGQDGKVILWSWGGSLTKVSEFCNMTGITKFLPGVTSLDVRADGNTILVGTRGSEIYEVQKTGKTDLLLQGHYEGELWGCSTSPNGMKYVTCGGDCTIRLWDAKKLWMITSTKPLENDVRGVDWSSNGNFIIAGDMKGKILLLDSKDLSLKDALQSSFTKLNQWIEDIKISPDNNLVAFGAHGGASSVEVMSIQNGNKLAKKYTINAGLTSALLHLDWSTDSSHVVVNSQAYELKFVNIEARKNTAASSAKDYDWASWTCKLGFPVQGVFQSVDYTDVNAVCRSVNKKILATGNDNSRIHLFKFPCVVEKAQFKYYVGHASHVTRVRFTYNDARLISTGGNDKCVLVWDTDFGTGAEAGENAGELEEERDDNEEEFEDDNNDYVQKKTKKDKYGRDAAGHNDNAEGVELDGGDDIFAVEKIQGGDEFLAVKPWTGAIREPTGWKKPPLNQNQAPKVSLTLEYVHGYRAKDCKNNLKYLQNGNVVYHAAAVGIVLDIATNTQRFFDQHIDDITAMDVHPNGILVATGELGPKPSIYVWDSNSMQKIFQFQGGLQKGIACLAFSPSGNRLAAAAIDNDHYVGVYNTEVGDMLFLEKGDTAIIVDVRFKNEEEFVTVGPKHYKFWTFQNKQISSKKGQFGKANNILRCLEFNGNTCLVGAADGNLQAWNGNSLGKTYPIHQGSVDSLSVGAQYVITGGVDGIINILDKTTYNVLLKLPLDSVAKTSLCTKIRAAVFSADHKNLLVGTYGSEVYELSTKDAKITSGTKFTGAKELSKGHYTPNQKWTNEVWGLAVFKDGDRWCSCSDDATLRIWSQSKRKQLKAARLNKDLNGNDIPLDLKTQDLSDSAKGRSLDISPDDKLIAVGCKDGTVRIFEADSLKQTHILKVAPEWIQELKFSPDGTRLAIGSHDNKIYIYVVGSFQKKFTMNKHSSFITHLDWSEDGNFLHSNCGAYELLFWDANTGKQVTSGATQLKDERWATWTCVLGWPVQGIWPPFTSGDDINYVSRSSSKTAGGYELLAMADDFGKVKLLRYPSIQKGSLAVEGKGHSSHVTCTKFGPSDNLLFSTGGEDNCVFQWKVEPEA